MSGPLLIDRVSINGKRYIASKDRDVIERFCEARCVPKDWIRYSDKHSKWYLRLWGRKRDV